MILHLRALALFRIALAAVLVVDLVARRSYVELLLTDSGYLPSAQLGLADATLWPSIYALFGTVAWVQGVMMVHLMAAIALMMGAGTRFIAPITWYLTLSMQQRNPLILNSGDALLQTLLFWGMLLPWAKRWSVDAWRSEPEESQEVRSWATLGLNIQMASLFVFSAIHQLMDPLWRQGEALALVMQSRLLYRQTPPGVAPGMGLEWVVILAQVAVAIALLGPWPRLRRPAIALTILALLAMAWALTAGLLPLVTMAGLLALWPLARDKTPARPLGGPQGWADGISLLALSLALLVNLVGLWHDGPVQRLHQAASLVSANQDWRSYTGPGLAQDEGTQVDIKGSDDTYTSTTQLRGPRGWRDDLYWQRLHEPRYQRLLEPFVKVASQQWSQENPGLQVKSVAVFLLRWQLVPGGRPIAGPSLPLWPRPQADGEKK